MGMTMAEKILARVSGREKVKPGENVTAKVDQVMSQEAIAEVYRVLKEEGVERVWDPNKIAILLDHYVPASTRHRLCCKASHRPCDCVHVTHAKAHNPALFLRYHHQSRLRSLGRIHKHNHGHLL